MTALNGETIFVPDQNLIIAGNTVGNRACIQAIDNNAHFGVC